MNASLELSRDDSVRASCTPRLRRLADCMDLSVQYGALAGAFTALTDPWGDVPARDLPRSDVSPDGSPVEFAISFAPDEPALQFAVEPMMLSDEPRVRWEAARLAVGRLVRQCGASDSKWNVLAPLLSSQPARTSHLVMLGAEVGRDATPRFKAWLYSNALKGADPLQASMRALSALGMPDAVEAAYGFARRSPYRIEPILISFDLHEGPTARVKVYFRHYAARPEALAGVLAEANGFDASSVSRVCRILAGSDASFATQAPVTAMTWRPHTAAADPSATLYVPLWTYAAHDGAVRDRVRRLLPDSWSTTRYDRALAELTSRPLESARGLHNYLSWQPHGGRPRIKLYWSPELRHSNPAPLYPDGNLATKLRSAAR